MTYKLKLKKRSLSKLTIPKELADEMLKQGDVRIIMQMLQRIAAAPEYYHDKDHFAMIVNWAPKEQGLPFTKTAQWVQIAISIAEVDTNTEPTIEFTENQKELLYERLRDPRFTVFGVNTPFYRFIADLEAAFGEPIYQIEEAIDGNKD